MPKESNPLQRTSVQLMIFVAAVALFANSAVDRTDDGLPWEVTLVGFCVFAVVFSAIYAKKTEVALSIVRCARIDIIVLRSLRSHFVRSRVSQHNRSGGADVFCAQL